MTLRGANTNRETPLGSQVDDDDVGNVFDDEIRIDDTGADADSPTRTQDDGRTPLTIARDVLAKTRGLEPDADAATSGSETATGPNGRGAAADGAVEGQPPVEDFSNLPFHTHPRFQQLIRERQELLQISRSHGRIVQAIDEAGLDPQEFASTLHIAGLMRRDPGQAFELLKPIMKQLGIDAGLILPDDIAQQLKAGKITRELALELSQTRARAANDKRLAEWTQQREAFAGQQRERVDIASAVSEWERQTAAKDPDFGLLKEGVIRRLRIRMADHDKTKPLAKADVLKWCREDLAAEKKYRQGTPQQMRELRPPRRVPIGGRSSADGAQGKPRDPMEVARRALGR